MCWDLDLDWARLAAQSSRVEKRNKGSEPTGSVRCQELWPDGRLLGTSIVKSRASGRTLASGFAYSTGDLPGCKTFTDNTSITEQNRK